MKRVFVRGTAVLIVFVFALSALAGCSASRPIKSTDEELAVVGSVGDFEVLYEELRYITLNYRETMKSMYGEDIWDNAEDAEQYRAELEELVYSSITYNYAILKLCREAYIEADDPTILEAVDSYMDEFIEDIGGRSEYKSQLAENNMTDHLLRFTIAVEYCRNELSYVYIDDIGLIESDDEKIYDMIMDGGCVRTLHVYIQNGEGEDVEENRALAEQVRERLLAGEDITKIIGSSINEDFSLTTTDGYYFFRGEMLTQYEDAAFGIDVGGISEVVETADGFYVIQRLPLEETYVLLNLETLISSYQTAQLDLFIEEERDGLVFVPNEYGGGLDLTKID